jgi:hypothetical protein
MQKISANDTQQNGKSFNERDVEMFCLSTIKPAALSVIMPIVVMLSVEAPRLLPQNVLYELAQKSLL